MSSQKVFVPAITNSEHTQASAASALTANEMTPKEILAMDKADLRAPPDEENQSKKMLQNRRMTSLLKMFQNRRMTSLLKILPKPSRRTKLRRKRLKDCKKNSRQRATRRKWMQRKRQEEKKALDIVAKEAEMEQSATAAATTTTTDSRSASTG